MWLCLLRCFRNFTVSPPLLSCIFICPWKTRSENPSGRDLFVRKRGTMPTRSGTPDIVHLLCFFPPLLGNVLCGGFPQSASLISCFWFAASEPPDITRAFFLFFCNLFRFPFFFATWFLFVLICNLFIYFLFENWIRWQCPPFLSCAERRNFSGPAHLDKRE